ncbi:hypothetical protein THOM_3017 [Trachipleistophora hominis]|uniref:Uncharacterized protein n=1 Tax=Trachipleistophora hominis TaxID=72359 RepID=L7JRY7_TRAHO|nr:hypothetical protein THOM_3017 [Trachipleistophora hominis]
MQQLKKTSTMDEKYETWLEKKDQLLTRIEGGRRNECFVMEKDRN